ncbi:hypothetical protein F5148DRAFT_1146398 [Russula earlei]|uniref:Uncharacterized protein n=1 Tax=Russula earlei TaxID=71964 RepID=A0ACC0ULZ7_9AGAM|nr:hypothetical protein F5148DRAFT_1146398 [Russula earlei]
MADNSLASYLLILLGMMGRQDSSVDNLPLGLARRVGATSSTFDVPAHKLLRAVIEHSPSPETISREILVELAKCEISAVKKLVDDLDGDRSVSPDDWAFNVHQELRQNTGNTTYLTALASHYLSHLIVAFRNPGGKTTPQESIHLTPDLRRIEEIESLLSSAIVHQSQSALKHLIFLRDGTRCPVTGFGMFGDDQVVIPRCAHIIPFSVHSKTHSYQAIETFTGTILKAEDVHQLINHPANAINIQNDAHDSMDKFLAWGIEATLVNDQWKYFFREVRPNRVAPTIRCKDGDEIKFGSGNGGNMILSPDPRICNLQLAMARVFAASGAAEVFDQYLEDDDDDDCMSQVPVYFGGPFVDDDTLMRRIEELVT